MVTSKMIQVNGNLDINFSTLVERTEIECNELKKSGYRIISINFVGNKSIIFIEKKDSIPPETQFDLFKKRVILVLDEWKNKKKLNVQDHSDENILETLQKILDTERLIYRSKEGWTNRCLSCTSFIKESCRCKNKDSQYNGMIIEKPDRFFCDCYKFICIKDGIRCSKSIYVDGVWSCKVKLGDMKPCKR